jgi:hypothetical protein
MKPSNSTQTAILTWTGWGKLRSWQTDIAIAVLLSIATLVAAWFLTGIQNHIPLLIDPKADDVWFEGDPARVFSNMTDRGGAHYRSNVHPLFSLIALTYTYICSSLLHLSKLEIVRVSIASAAAIWITLLYALLRILGCRKPDSALLSLVGATSAAAVFWTAIPETYLLGSVTVIAVLITSAFAERRAVPPWLDVAMAAGALAITVTNWMVALASLATRHRLKPAIQLASNSFVAVVLLMGIQKYVVPSSVFLFDLHGEGKAIVRPEPLATLKVFFLHTMVLPDFRLTPQAGSSLWPQLTIQHANNWQLSHWGPLALAAWLTLLVAGAWTYATMKALRRFRLTVVIALTGQFALHLVYGSETFLYSLDWLPLLIVIAALPSQTRLRPLVLSAASIFVISAIQHNYAALELALVTLASSAGLNP